MRCSVSCVARAAWPRRRASPEKTLPPYALCALSRRRASVFFIVAPAKLRAGGAPGLWRIATGGGRARGILPHPAPDRRPGFGARRRVGISARAGAGGVAAMTRTGEPRDAPATRVPARTWPAVALVFLGSGLALYLLCARFPVLPDGDSYYHLAVARAYAEHGLSYRPDWARFSIMHDGFGDKELLFHVLLMPFARLADATRGGVVALALLGALVAAVLAHQATAAIGRWGLAVPLLVFGGAADFMLRAIRLRPELLSLLLILLAIPLASRRRPVLLGVLACLYALGYTAFQAFLGLCLLFFLCTLWVERRAEWRLVVYPAIGVALGLLLHPQFPANVRVWLVQNVGFFVRNETVDLGPEILPRTTRDTLLLNLGWWAGLVVLWRSRSPIAAPSDDRRLCDFTALAAAAFGLLYLLMYRFVIYAVPLATLALLRCMQAAGEVPGRFTRLPGRGRVPFALVFSLCLLSAAPLTRLGLAGMQAAMSRVWRPDMRADWEAFARAMPEGAKVAAPWAATEAFVFWAPRAAYLNVLDPLFMAARDAATYRRYLDLFEGREADIPLLATARFESEFYADDGQYPFAKARLATDPRVAHLHDGITFLYRFLEGRNADFLLDWKVLPEGAPMPPPLDLVADPALPLYPRAATERERAVEGYVDGRRLGAAAGCIGFARAEDVERATRLVLEVSPYGSAEVFVDDRPTAAIPSPRAAVLGRGVVLSLALDPGRHRLAIRTCPAEGQVGFYALVRGRESAPP